jgi:hypothetical protein
MTAMAEPVNSVAPVAWTDARQSAAALEIQRGVVRLLLQHGVACVTELPLPNGRRADVIGLTGKGDIWIVEIKSSLEDFRADHKWPEYREFSDRLFFAVKPDFPVAVLPGDTGLILADRYGGEIAREAPETRLAGSRRKSMTRHLARAAAFRLSGMLDPSLPPIIEPVGGG